MVRLRLSCTWLCSAASAIAFVLVLPAVGSAQVYPSPRDADRAYASDQSLEQLSMQLEATALRARDSARTDQHRHGREEVTEKMSDFAKHAHELRLLLAEREVPSSRINDQVRKLVDDARKVQNERAKSNRVFPQTDAEWNRTVSLLDQINNQYLASNGLAPRGTTGADRDSDRNRAGWSDRQQTMLTDLDRRADDAARLSESSNLEISSDIGRLRDQVRSFRQTADELSMTDRRANIAHMLADARAVQADLSGSNAPPQLRDDINSMVGTLVQMRDMTGERVEGTAGYGPPPGVATDRDADRYDAGRYATMDVPQLARELDTRLSSVSDSVATNAEDEVRNDVAHFRDKARDFDDRAATMSREDRREAIDSLLQDAQKTQRDLARHHASADVTNQWNSIVDLLVKMRDRS